MGKKLAQLVLKVLTKVLVDSLLVLLARLEAIATQLVQVVVASVTQVLIRQILGVHVCSASKDPIAKEMVKLNRLAIPVTIATQLVQVHKIIAKLVP